MSETPTKSTKVLSIVAMVFLGLALLTGVISFLDTPPSGGSSKTESMQSVDPTEKPF